MTATEFQAVFGEHQDAVYRFAWRMTNSAATAEDIAQDVFLSFLRHPDRFDPGRGRLRPFLPGITRNLEEIARAVESEVGTVKSRLYRARENLKRILARSSQAMLWG